MLFCLAARGAAGQQFQQQPGLLPVPTDYWTEAVTPVDADEDGRWDVLFVHANGWSVPGDFGATGTFPLPPILLLNTGTSGGNPVFVDATSSYLPSGLTMHGKGASVADFDADGHDDIVLASAFGARQHLLMKQPGTLEWVEESGRLPPLFLNCFSAGVGDLDDDGDMDIVFTDAGPQSFSGPGGKARLMINDGNGYFTEQATWLNAVNKVGAQNAKIFDIDNDFDLDVIIDGKSPQTQVYFNDAQAHFTVDTTVIPSASSSTYEAEWGDLDGDSDLDAAFMGVSGFTDGTLQNFLSDTGTLSFALTSTTLTGVPASQDDNEFVLIDADDDGDMDVITVSLSGQQEKLYFSSGVFGPGFLNCTPGLGFTQITDSSLDMCMADFDGDGDYDAITGQGESGNFTDRYYRNTGPADTLPPRIGRVQAAPVTVTLATITSGGLVRHAWIQDSVWDDGRTFETARLLMDTDKLGETGSSSAAMSHIGGQIFRGLVQPAPASTGLVGMHVDYRIQASDPYDNTSVSGPESFVVCGAESYGPAGSLALAAGGDPVLGASFAVTVSGGPPGQPGLIAVGAARASLFGGTLLVDPGQMLLFPLAFDGTGAVSLAAILPGDEAFAGVVLDLQAFALDPSKPHGIGAASNGLEIALCTP
ncbi:MAG TPA: FG-GAP-like repeat-containing protein [Planctomycetota bacterium]|nr:FG-GAP-like repeat-containing protein [Planctomycetota bacterium]